MSEEKDEATAAAEAAAMEAGQGDGGLEDRGRAPQLITTPGMPERKAVGAARPASARFCTLPPKAREVILDDLEGTHKLPTHTL